MSISAQDDYRARLDVAAAKYPGNKNETRADWAQIALDAFAEQVGAENEPTETNIRDLITDLCHLADRKGLDMDALIEAGRGMYGEETTYSETDPDDREQDCGPACELDPEGIETMDAGQMYSKEIPKAKVCAHCGGFMKHGSDCPNVKG